MTSVSSKLVQEALIKKTNDNVTVMVVKLRDDVSQIRSSS
jgi:serine/threonine protein phosphatase PrpC